jgi:predicted 2-oxoglutarate/Fe(II)-dependent dioxygenase YbiX
MTEITGFQITLTKQRLYYVDQTCVPLPWHDDSYDKDGRVAAIRFELSDAPYEGGDFVFKDEKDEYKFEHLQLGESVLFKVEFNKCFHQVSSVLKGRRKSLVVFLCE